MKLEEQMSLPDPDIAAGYLHAAGKNVLAAVNEKVFPGYWSVCADGQGFGFGNTYPSLDGHQMTDALLWLGQERVVKANWDYVRTFQRPDGQLPLAILPGEAGKEIGPEATRARVDPNGGLYVHWVPGDPLRALAVPTFIQNADSIFRHTLDAQWLNAQLPAVNLAAGHLATLVTAEGLVKGAGYYVERPLRAEYDGVSQCYVADAFRKASELNQVAGQAELAQRFSVMADRIVTAFRRQFWTGERFAEYIHPQHGRIDSHGLTDTNWAALAMGLADESQRKILWPKMRMEQAFYYGGMPTGIATRPKAYEEWEFTHPDRHDLAAMGRVWFLECWARAYFADGKGIVDTLGRVCAVGRENGWHWRERYYPGQTLVPAGPDKYCEYASNLIRIVQRFVFGVELTLHGGVVLAPNVPGEWWREGFGQTLAWRDRSLTYTINERGISGSFEAPASRAGQSLSIRFPREIKTEAQATIDGQKVNAPIAGRSIDIHFKAPCKQFEIVIAQ